MHRIFFSFCNTQQEIHLKNNACPWLHCLYVTVWNRHTWEAISKNMIHWEWIKIRVIPFPSLPRTITCQGLSLAKTICLSSQRVESNSLSWKNTLKMSLVSPYLVSYIQQVRMYGHSSQSEPSLCKTFPGTHSSLKPQPCVICKEWER